MNKVCIGGSVVECSPAIQAARVRFPADADIHERRLLRDLHSLVPPTSPHRVNGTDTRASIRHHVNATEIYS